MLNLIKVHVFNGFGVYLLLCTLLPAMGYQLVLGIRDYRRGKKCQIWHLVWVYVFLIYIWMVFDVTGIGTLADVLRDDTMLFSGGINLKPFDSMGMGYLLNIIMFMPFGFLVPFIWRNMRSLGRTMLLGAGFSAMIEISQLFNFRAMDIDDLTANICGAATGYLIWKVFVKICGEHLKSEERGKMEAVVYVVMALLGVFFLYNPYRLLGI